MTLQDLLIDTERIHTLVRNDADMVHDSEVVIEVLTLSYSLLTLIREGEVTDDHKRVARLLLKCYPKESLKLKIFEMNLMSKRLL